MINVLERMLDKTDRIKYIVIECNGLADPSQLIQTFWMEDSLLSKL